ncbi:MAG: UDP-3-O-(3-hydroxymyristoyl)glucosamine N-acyltransferase [Alphaproteobacteria bacterium]|nr:UDP-3-O-(3-hydroxymyristoyl)glucosamine N-acyltransferase [Alphaproteobacteria bacterium]
MSTPSYSLEEIADALGGRLIGNGKLRVSSLVHPANVSGPEDLALAMEPGLLSLVKKSKAAAAVVAGKEEDSAFIPARILVERPRVAMAKLTALFAKPVEVKPGIHPTAVVEEGAKIGKNPSIGAFAYVGARALIGDNAVLHPQCYIGEDACIGNDALIHAGAKIGAGTRIGDRAIVHFNASIGADGFSYVTPQVGSVEAAKAGSGGTVTASNASLIRIASLAPVILGDDVEIGANTSIDRGTVASTRVGNGTKIDNQVQIGHNVTIGDNCMICGRVGIAGSAVIGNRVVLGGAVGVADHVTVGDDAIAMAMSGIAGNVPPKTIVGGLPAAPREKMMENLFNLGRLKQLFKKVETLVEKMDRFEKNSISQQT